MILDHIGFHVSDVATARRFFVDALAPLGIGITNEGEGRAMIGRDGHDVESTCSTS
jgi:catechol 2,3-dioxygenase-like lactoylglutathione lyase family enzyme